MKLTTLFILSILIATQLYSQEHLEVEGSARVEQSLTVESLAGNGMRNVVADQNGKLIIEAKKTGVISIPAESFLPINNVGNYQRIRDFIPITIIPPGVDPSTTSDASFFAPIQLPHGVVLDSIRMYYIDNSVDNDLSILLEGFDANLNLISTIASLQPVGTPSASLNDRVSMLKDINSIVVDNSRFTYRIFLGVQDQWDAFVLGVSNIHIYYTEW